MQYMGYLLGPPTHENTGSEECTTLKTPSILRMMASELACRRIVEENHSLSGDAWGRGTTRFACIWGVRASIMSITGRLLLRGRTLSCSSRGGCYLSSAALLGQVCSKVFQNGFACHWGPGPASRTCLGGRIWGTASMDVRSKGQHDEHHVGAVSPAAQADCLRSEGGILNGQINACMIQGARASTMRYRGLPGQICVPFGAWASITSVIGWPLVSWSGSGCSVRLPPASRFPHGELV